MIEPSIIESNDIRQRELAVNVECWLVEQLIKATQLRLNSESEPYKGSERVNRGDRTLARTITEITYWVALEESSEIIEDALDKAVTIGRIVSAKDHANAKPQY